MNGSRTSCDQPTTKISSGSSARTACTVLSALTSRDSTSAAPTCSAESSKLHWPERFGSTGLGSVTIPTTSAPASALASTQRRPMTSKLTQTVRTSRVARRRVATVPAARRALVRPGQERQRRARQDLQLEPRRTVVDVPDVELDPLVPRQRGAAVHLRPARQPRLHLEPAPLRRRVLLDLVAERRPRPDDRHVSAEDVPELRELVQRQPAQHAADARDPRVADVDRVTRALPLGADAHR